MLDVRDAPVALRAAAAALRAVDAPIRREINTRTRETIGPVWKAEVDRRMSSPLDQVVLGRGVRIKAGNPPQALAAQSRRRLSGGLVPQEDWAPFEFGATNRDKVTTYTRTSPKGTRHQVTRHTARQLPARDPSGRVVFAAFAEVAPRAVSLWAATIIRTVYEGLEDA